MSRQFPTSYDAVRSAVIAFMRSCDPYIQKLQDRQLLKAEIERLRGGTGAIGTGLKNTGVTRSMDPLGRVVIPKELRRTLGLDAGQTIEFFVDDAAGVVYVQKFNMKKCAVCDFDESLTKIKGKYLCEDCISRVFEGEE